MNLIEHDLARLVHMANIDLQKDERQYFANSPWQMHTLLPAVAPRHLLVAINAFWQLSEATGTVIMC